MKSVLAIMFLLGLAACGGSHAPSPNASSNSSDQRQNNSTDNAPLEASFVSIKTNILQTKCLSCHAGGGNASDVNLETAAAMINSPREIVIPGNVDESGLTIAITRTDDKMMPPRKSGGPLSTEEIEAIKKWIQEGASR